MNKLEVNLKGFCSDIETLNKEVRSSLGPADYKHLLRTERYGRIAALLGYSTAWIFPNPLTAFLISLSQFTRWLMAHHILHRGYDNVPGVPHRYTSKGFAVGKRRFLDWFDWMLPRAWDYEHNILHHYHTGEDADPDLAERHTEFLRAWRIPKFLKYIFVGVAACTWKFTYYAPSTMSVLEPESKKRIKQPHIIFITIKNIFQFRNKHVRMLWLQGYLPYGLFHFAVIPALFFPLGQTAVLYVFLNKVLAEIFTNIHSFLVIGPNHTADDLYRFSFHYDDKAQFYLTQVLGSANYNCGDEVRDYLSIYLNYQIEHHLFPDLPMLKYREIQPQVKQICEKWGVPYQQESIFKRFKRMVDVCVGNTAMKEMSSIQEVVAMPVDKLSAIPPAASQPVVHAH